MTAYDAAEWRDFFVMIGGAAAALAGLLFVAVSFNGKQVLGSPPLSWMAARSLLTILAVVVAAAFGLAPQPVVALGLEVLALGLAMTIAVAVTTARSLQPSDRLRWRLAHLGLATASSVPMVLAGVFLTARIAGGLYWLLGECVSALVAGAIIAWTLLVEVRRGR